MSVANHAYRKSKLRVCIVSTEFIGPTRGGGIATFFSTLAERLADAEYEVTLLYVLGQEGGSENDQHWVDQYAERRIRFVSIPTAGAPSPQPAYVRRSFDAYQWLAARRFDVVHFADAQGVGYYTCAAKHQGRGFEDTVLNVSTQGGTIYLREACERYLERIEDLELDFMERESVAFADTVVSPSQFMLDWMKGRGWKLPAHRFVRQNLLPSAAQVPRRGESDSCGNVDEVVFFGKASELKGLVLFCDALDRLVERDPDLYDLQITFLGRGESVRGTPAVEYLAHRASAWPFHWKLIGDRDQRGAVEYLMRDNLLAVIPSLMDNSPSTVLECLGGGVPLLASDVGGIPELVAPEDRDRVLFELRAEALAEKLCEVLRNGARPSNAAVRFRDNESEWLDWHERVVAGGLSNTARPVEAKTPSSPSVRACVTHRDSSGDAHDTLSSLLSQSHQPVEVVCVDEAMVAQQATGGADRLESELVERGVLVRRGALPGGSAARATAAREADSDYLVFLDSDHVAKPDALSTLVRVAERTGAAMVTSVVDCVAARDSLSLDVEPAWRWLVLGSADAAGMFRNPFGSGAMLFRRDAYESIGGFPTDHSRGNGTWELVARGIRRGMRLEVVAEPLFWVREPSDGTSFASSGYSEHTRSLRPYQDSVPSSLRDVLSLAIGQFHRMDHLERTIEWQRTKTSELEKRTEELEAIGEWSAARAGRPGELACLLDAGRLLLRMDEHELGESLLVRALSMAERAKSAPGIWNGSIALSSRYAAAERGQAALEAVEAAIEIAVESRDPVATAQGHAHLGALRMQLEPDSSSALECLEVAIRMANEAGEKAVNYCYPLVAQAFLRAGLYEQSRSLCAELLARADRDQDRGAAAKALFGLGAISRATGRMDEACSQLLASVKAARDSKDVPLLLELLRDVGNELAQIGQNELARTCLTTLERLASDTQNAYTLLRAREALRTLDESSELVKH